MTWVSSNQRPARTGVAARLLAELLSAGGVAWLVVFSSVALSYLGIRAIDVATEGEPAARHVLGAIASKQLLLALVGLAGGAVAAMVHYRVWGWSSWLFFGVAIALIVFTLLPFVPTWLVRPRNGARGWIDLGPFELQPAELAKVAYVLALAWYLRYSTTHRTFRGLIPPALITGVPVALITLQPDLGSASLYIPVLFTVLAAAGAKLKHLAIVVLAAALAAPAVYPALKPHQKQRIEGLIQQVRGDTSADQDVNMQSVVAQRLIGAGEAVGMGEAKSRAIVQYSRLPERHNDMVFAVVVNRWGLAGGLWVVGLYLVWVVSALATAWTIREPFARLTIIGFATFMLVQVFVNMGMNLGIVPIIGVTLPFVSYGGSSLVTGWLMTGIVIGIAVRRPGMPRYRSFEYSESEEVAVD